MKEYLCMPEVTVALYFREERPLTNPILFESHDSALRTRMPSEMSLECPDPVLFQLHCAASKMPRVWLFTKWTLIELGAFLNNFKIKCE